MNLSILEIFTNSVDPDEVPLNVASNQALTCLIWYISAEYSISECYLLRVHMIMDFSI